MVSGTFGLVATLGPSSFHLAGPLAGAGATMLRLNTSHMDLAGAQEAAHRARSAAPDTPLIFDLQGAKMRLGICPPRKVRAGEDVVFGLEAGRSEIVHVPHAELFGQADVGDTLSIDDDRIRLEVVSRGAGSLVARARQAGTLRGRKGLNVVEHPVGLSDLTPADQAYCGLAAGMGASVAVSFMVDGSEASWVRRRAPGVRVVGKVERGEAVAHLEQLTASVDVVWICRGDLGAQIGAAALARLVASLRPADYDRPFLMAGQVLEHLTEHPSPTRSEVCHLHDLIARGYAGIVLSDETAIGRDPVAAVREAASLLAALGA